MFDSLKSLAQRFKKTHAFFSQENLENLILKYDQHVALLVIDVQKEFCDPAGRRGNGETEEISGRIQSIVPAFRKAGVPVYAVYFSRNGEKNPQEIDFYKFQPAPEDKLVAKNTDSAFHSGKLKDILAADKPKLLLACGFNQIACVLDTVLSARQLGYDICLMEDLTGNDKGCLIDKRWASSSRKEMLRKGAVMTTSAEVLKHLHAKALRA